MIDKINLLSFYITMYFAQKSITVSLVHALKCTANPNGLAVMSFEFMTSDIYCHWECIQHTVRTIGMYLYGFEKRILTNHSKWSSLRVGNEQAEVRAIGQLLTKLVWHCIMQSALIIYIYPGFPTFLKQ